MKQYLTISADIEFGEAGLTKSTTKWIEDCIKSNPILAADILKDAVFDLTNLYNQAVDNIYPHIKAEVGKREA